MVVSMSLIDFIKFNIFKVRSPELVSKMKFKELINKINSNKYQFINPKTEMLSADLASFVYDIYKVIYPIQNLLKNDFDNKDSSFLISSIVECYFTKEQKQSLNTLTGDYIREQVSSGENINQVFTKVKANFKSLQGSVSDSQIKLINNAYNSLKNFSEIARFDFFVFLRNFDNNIVEGDFSRPPKFRATRSVQIIDDLSKLDSAVSSIAITAEVVEAVEVYQKSRDMSVISTKNIKALLVKIKFLQKTELLSNIIKYMLKDLLYKTILHSQKTNIYIKYISSLTETLKHDMETIIKDIKNSKISAIRERVFKGISIINFSGLNDEYNNLLEKFDMPIIDAIEPLQYVQTFIIEIYERDLQNEINNICVSSEFINKKDQKAQMDAYYHLNIVRETILKLDAKYNSNTSEGKRLRLMLASKNKAVSNQTHIEMAVKKINEECNEIIIATFNSIVDLATILKNIIDDVNNHTKKMINNSKKLVHDNEINFEIIEAKLPSIDNFIMLLKYFVR